MTGVHLNYLYCDHPDCRDQSPIEGGPGESLASVRRLANRMGWRRSKGKDICSLHPAARSAVAR